MSSSDGGAAGVAATSAPAPTPSGDRIPLAEPTIGGNAARYLQECLDTNYVSSVGPFVERFENEFAAVVGSRFAVACASGTAAIHLALRVLDIGPGDEVLVPSLTFVASVNPIAYVGATPVLVDSEIATWNLDPEIVVGELDRRSRLGLRQPAAIEVVDLVGHPAAIEPIAEAAERHGVTLIEDASEALGATYVGGALDGRHVGSIGRVGCFSFNGNKLITTGGGGMLVTDDEGSEKAFAKIDSATSPPIRAAPAYSRVRWSGVQIGRASMPASAIPASRASRSIGAIAGSSDALYSQYDGSAQAARGAGRSPGRPAIAASYRAAFARRAASRAGSSSSCATPSAAARLESR